VDNTPSLGEEGREGPMVATLSTRFLQDRQLRKMRHVSRIAYALQNTASGQLRCCGRRGSGARLGMLPRMLIAEELCKEGSQSEGSRIYLGLQIHSICRLMGRRDRAGEDASSGMTAGDW
jgi:hypothetical protein